MLLEDVLATEEADKPVSQRDKSLIHSDLTDKIIAAAYDVHNQLGFGFAEKVRKCHDDQTGGKRPSSCPASADQCFFEGNLVGEYFADILVEGAIIVEIKAVSETAKIHEAQLINYLKATGKRVGLLINFSEKLKIVRRAL